MDIKGKKLFRNHDTVQEVVLTPFVTENSVKIQVRRVNLKKVIKDEKATH